MSWEQLLNIFDQQRQDVEEFERTPPVACPIDGEPLEVGPRGELHCPCGNYTWPET